ncbi:MAG TPA: sulfatase [Gemmatimonadales bacterium]|nr:sulfatase [Gemmatimonadales bacterium]
MTPSEARASGEDTEVRYPGILVVALWCTLAAGVLEGSWRLFQRFGLGKVIRMPLDIVWMAPLVDALWLLAPAILLLIASRLAPQRFSFPMAAGLLGGFASLPVLLLIESMHKGVTLLLAVAVGIQVARWTREHGTGFARLERTTLPALGLIVVAGAALVVGIPWMAEQKAMGHRPPAAIGKPNVLLLVWDTVRDDALSVSGYRRPTTPFLETVAREGTRFEWALSTAPWTLPSHGSMFTGEWPYVFFRGTRIPLDFRSPTLAEVFSRAGYRTAGFTGNLAFTLREYRLDQGFQHYEDFSRNLGTALSWSRISWVALDQPWVRKAIGYHDRLDRKRAGVINSSFFRWLDMNRSGPFFVFLNYFDAHDPYVPPSPFGERFAVAPDPSDPKGDGSDRIPSRSQGEDPRRGAYDALIASLDDATRHLFEGLARRGLLDSTIVIIASDHGELFGEHGLYRHMNGLYRELLQVPLLIRYPASVRKGEVVKTPVSLRDIPRTALTLAGVTPDSSIPGHSLTRFWNSEGPIGSDSLVWSELSNNYGERLGPHAIVSNGLYYIRRGRDSVELYQLLEDRDQSTNLSRDPARSSDLSRFRQLTDSLAGLYRELPPGDGDDEEEDQL